MSLDADLNLEKLFLPAWATETPSANRYENYTGREESRSERRPSRDRNDRGPRRDGPGGPGAGGPPRGQARGPGGSGAPQGRRDFRDDRGPRRGGGGPDRRDDRFEHRDRPPETPLPELEVLVSVDDKGVDSLARQIRVTGRAYPMFDIAQLLLQKPERHQFVFTVIKKPDGTPAQPMFHCMLDDTLWLAEDEAVAHVLDRHFNTFYQVDRTPTDPPKGVYTFVAQCGMSGIILGPPNNHDYQARLHRLHTERFSRMPFDMFKSRVKIVRDEAVVKKWIDDQSWKTEFLCLNVPDALKLPNREAVEKHFRETHLANIIRPVETYTLSGVIARQLRSPGMQRLVRAAWEEQKRFPLKMVAGLSALFAGRGLQFFKREKSITHVSVARPHFLDLELEPVSDGVKSIINFINATAKCTRQKLVEALAPSPVSAKPPVPAPAPAEGAAPSPAPAPELTPEQSQVVSDLHWLIHQGHVIEFANGTLETAKRPLPKPVKPEPKPQAKPAPAPAVPAERTVQPSAESAPVSPTAVVTETPVAPIVEAPAAPVAEPVVASTENPPAQS